MAGFFNNKTNNTMQQNTTTTPANTTTAQNNNQFSNGQLISSNIDSSKEDVNKRFTQNLNKDANQNASTSNKEDLEVKTEYDSKGRAIKPTKTYSYTILNDMNKKEKSSLVAETEEEVRNFLVSQHYRIVNVELRKATDIEITFGKISAQDLAFSLTQLSTYIKSGIPLVESVAILSRQTKKKRDRYLYQKIVFELSKGSSFSDALTMQGNVFPRLVINMVKTSELTGDLTTILDDLALYYKDQNATRKQIISAMTYPSVVFIFAITIISFIFIYVVPKFVDIFDQVGSELPLITVIVMNISSYLQANYILVFGLAVLIILAIVTLYKKVASFRRVCQIILMHIPVVKNIIMYNEVIMFTSTFASLVNHDVFITDSMEILKTISNNEIYKSLISKAIDNLSLGDGVSKAFQGHWAFPSTAYEMLVTGEKTGRLGPMMQTVADYYREEQKALVTQLKSLIEPIMIVFLAVIVGITLLSIIIPMFSMYSSVL